MTGNGNHTTYKNGHDWGDGFLMFIIVLPTLIYIYTAWWFGTWILWLSIYWECHHPNWLISFRGVETTNQYIYIHNIIWIYSEGRDLEGTCLSIDGLVRWKDLAISSNKTSTCHLICLSPSSRCWVHSSNSISINLSCDVQCLMTMGSEWLYKNAAFLS